jgi:hypothetical protein
MSSCPRCGSPKTNTKAREIEPGADVVAVDQWCGDCGWHGVGSRVVPPKDRVPVEPESARKRKKKQGDIFTT